MGIRGLTTFINQRSEQYYDNYELHDCYVVLDGSSIASQLYKWHCKCNDCFGGDYDKFANVVQGFFQLLFDCNIVPLVVIDGGYEKKKVKTVFSRMRNKIETAHTLNPVTETSVSVFPLFTRNVFMDIAKKMGVKCFCSTFEADGETAFLARSLNCPVLSYDSDFYIFDCLYIPFLTVELRLRKKKNVNYIYCKVYNVDKFLNSFGGLNKINLPLLAVLLGNDYITKSNFSPFYRNLKLQRGKQNEQQRTIKTVIMWLKDETPESALRKILSRYKSDARRKIAQKIEIAIRGYQAVNTEILLYFNFELEAPRENQIHLPKLDEIPDEAEEDSKGDESSSDEEYDENTEKVLTLPKVFKEKYKQCVYPPSFMDMIINDTFYCSIQVEDLSSEHSHSLTLPILQAMHKILASSSEKNLICVARCGRSDIKRYTLALYEKQLPSLLEIEAMNLTERKRIMLEILNISDNNLLNSVPSSWHLFVLSMIYWVVNSKSKIDVPYIYSVILCAIILNYVDSKIGFYRSTSSFLNKYGMNIERKRDFTFETDFKVALNKIDKGDSILCFKKLIYYFQMDLKMRGNCRLYDKVLVHEFSCFQTCLLHIKNLNILLNNPYPLFIISDFYDGTFLYNMTTNLKKRTDLKSYIKLLLDDCPTVLNSFELMADIVVKLFDSSGTTCDISQKRRRRRKRNKKTCLQDQDQESKQLTSDEENATVDENNYYALLAKCK